MEQLTIPGVDDAQRISTPTQEEVDKIANDNATVADPVDFHINFLQTNFPQFKRCTEVLSKKELIRVLNALVGFPFFEEKPKCSTVYGRHSFDLGLGILNSKYYLSNAQNTIEGMNKLVAKEEELLDNKEIATEVAERNEEEHG